MTAAPSFVLRGAQVLDESGSFSGPLDVHVSDGGEPCGVDERYGEPVFRRERSAAGLDPMPTGTET